MATLMLAFSRPRDEKDGPTFGPFPWVQLTYNELRVGADGDTIAFCDADGDWHLGQWVKVSPDMKTEPWSDIVIYAEEPAT